MPSDVEVLEDLCDELWGDPDDDPRPDMEDVGKQVVKVMVAGRLDFQEACREILAARRDVEQLEAQLELARARVRGLVG